MITLLRREFTVEVPLQKAWQHLARIEQWPSWAKHIRQVERLPPGKLGPGSTGHLHLNTPVKSGWPGSSAEFTVTENSLHHRHALSPYLGESLRGVDKRTYVSGRLVFHQGGFAAEAAGREFQQ